VTPANNQIRETFIKWIESQSLIEKRYSNIKRLTENAGEGYFSLMFTAFDNATNQKVALKFFDPQRGDNQYRLDCFGRETKMLQMFKGRSNILQIMDGKSSLIFKATTAEGLPFQLPLQFFATELARSDLTDYINSPTTSAKQNFLFFGEMCKAVRRIHRRRVCHRDLKPSNFLIFPQKDPRNKLRLSDFGTSRSFDRNAEPLLQRYEGPAGDITYTSPELLFGLHSEEQCSFSNDLYSLGAILFEIFAKMNLNLILFNDIREIRILIELSYSMRERDRRTTFHDSIKGIARRNPLPDIFAFNGEVPNCIKNRLNAFYKSLANLDYRRRLGDFTTVFRQLNICSIILREEEKYKRWKQMKKRFKKQTNKTLEQNND